MVNIQLKKTINKLYLYKSLGAMFFAVPVLVLFWQENGLNLTEIMILQSIFSIFTVLLEIPSGYIADIFGRKKSLLISSFMGVIAFTIYSIGHNFYHFMIAELFFALMVSFISGTLSALIYDTLQEYGEESIYQKVWGTAYSIGLISLAFSNAAGGFIAKQGLRLPLIASIPFIALTIPILLTIKEPKRNKLIIKKGYFSELIHIIKESFIRNGQLRWIIIYSGTIYAFGQSVLWLYQPYFKIIELDIAYFGIVFALFQIVAALSAKYSNKIEAKLGASKSLILLVLILSSSYILMGKILFSFSFIFCFAQQFIRGFQKVVISDYINKLCKSSIRATVLSFESFISRLIYAAIVPMFGWLADIYSLVQALLIMGISTIIIGLILILILKFNKVI